MRVDRNVRHKRWLLLGLLLLAPTAPAAVVLSGEVYAVNAQSIMTPPSEQGQVVLRSFTPEGASIKAGDVVLRIDGGSAASSMRELKSQHTLAKARGDKETAELQVKAVDAERLLRVAEVTLEKARLDASIPAVHLSKLDYDRYQGEALKNTREVEVKMAEWKAATAAGERRAADARLELANLQTQIDYAQTQLAAAEVLAERDGVVVHGFDPWRGNRFDEGSSSFSGQRVGEIVDASGASQLGVRAWALDVDRTSIRVDQRVSIAFDALGGSAVPGVVKRISGAPQAKAEWGDGRYFEIEVGVALPAEVEGQLRPGSSARVQLQEAGAMGSSARSGPVKRLDGEIVAFEYEAIGPPSLGDQWVMGLTQLVPDGTQVMPGQVVASFDGNETARKLDEKRSSLNEKRSQLASLLLALGERERAERIATAEQQAKLTKAERKATQPEDLIGAMEYSKLVAERRLAQAEMALVQRREQLSARQRVAEREQVEAEIELLQAQVSEMEKGMGELNVKATRAGVMLHLSNGQGEKFDVGAQVYRGQTVAQIPDMTRLGVRLQVPERDINAVRGDQRVRVDVEGGAVPTLFGKVIEIGRVVRSRSRVNPVPVVDVRIEFEELPEGAKLKPGQPVRVELMQGAGA